MTYSGWEQFVMPVYEGYYSEDRLGAIEQDGFNRESNDAYGPFYQGEIMFVQKGTM